MQKELQSLNFIQLKIVSPIIFQGVAKVLRLFLCKRDIQAPNNKEVQISCHYPGSRAFADLQICIPVEGCKGLLNQLHTLEMLQVRPWMEDGKYS